jgi:hypothetical protein
MKAIAKAGIDQKSFKHGCAAMSITRGLQYRTQFVDYCMVRNPEFHTAWSDLQALTLHRPSFVACSKTAKIARVSSNMMILDIDISYGGNTTKLLGGCPCWIASAACRRCVW